MFKPIEALEPRTLLSSWYVSAAGGADANPGTLAQPLRTIQAAANHAKPGDTVFIRGGTYHETVVPPASGTAAAPITFRPYGSESVTLDGADPISGWTNYRGSIYQALQPWTMGLGSDQVFVDGQMMNEARWPNTTLDLSHPIVATASTATASVASSGPSSATFGVPSLTDTANAWVGATIHVSPGQGWVYQTGVVTASAPGTLTYSYQQLTKWEVPFKGNRFYLTGKFQALDSPTEWFHDPTTNQLYLWTPSGDNPAGHVVEAKHRLYAFDLSGRAYVNVQGLNLFAATINTDAASSHLVLSGLNAKYLSHSTINAVPWAAKNSPHTTGIILNGTSNVLKDSAIAFSSGDGVFLGGANNTVQNTTIHDVGYAAGDDGGVYVIGTNDQVLHNTIYNVARSGVTHYFSAGTQILYNLIHDIGLQTSDAGGTYAWQTDGKGTRIAYNVIYNARGAGFGNTGVFLDNGCFNFIVDHNLVYAANSALKMNPTSRNNQIYNNTLVGQFSLGSGANADMLGSVFENNIMLGTAVWGVGAVHQKNVFTDPGFVNAAGGNYQLQAGSPAIDAGMVFAPYTNGYAGAAPDAGAYEFGRPAFVAGAGTSVPSLPARNARSTIEAESFDAQSGVQVQTPGIGHLDNGDWVRYSNVDFGAGVSTFAARLAVIAATAGKQIEIHLDSVTGTLIGTLTTVSTGDWNSFVTQSTKVSGARGLHDLYLVFRGGYGVCNLDSFTFG